MGLIKGEGVNPEGCGGRRLLDPTFRARFLFLSPGVSSWNGCWCLKRDRQKRTFGVRLSSFQKLIVKTFSSFSHFFFKKKLCFLVGIFWNFFVEKIFIW